MEKFWKYFDSEQKFNLFLGDEYSKYDNTPSREELCDFIWNQIPESLKYHIQERSSLSEISQTFLDLALSSRSSLLYNFNRFFQAKKFNLSYYKKILESNQFDAIFTASCFLPLEKTWHEYVQAYSPFTNPLDKNAKIPFYKILGSAEKKDTMIVSSQDYKKLMCLDCYHDFWSEMRKEFLKRPTLLVGVDLENKDIQKILFFLLEEIRYEKETIYLINSQSILNTNVMNFINYFDIKVLNCDLESFQNFYKNIEKQSITTDSETKIENTESQKKKYSHWEINDDIQLEDNTEIQFSSLQLKKFPIAYQNFSSHEKYTEIIPLGVTNCQIGDQTIYHVNIRAFLYKNFRLLEFKTREFRLAFSVELFDDKFFCRDSYLQYEISNHLLNSRLHYIFLLFQNIFYGSIISFQYNNVISELTIQNQLEALKFQKLISLLEDYQTMFEKFINKKEKNFSSLNTSFYNMEILSYYEKGKKEYDAWVNLKIKKGEIAQGDYLSFSRTLSYSLQNLPYKIEQTFTLKDPVGELNGEEEFIQFNRKPVSISLKAIENKD